MTTDVEAKEAIATRRKKLVDLAGGGLYLPLRNREYAVTMDWKYRALGNVPDGVEPGETLEQSVAVDKGTIFYADGVDSTITLVATVNETGLAANVTMTPSIRWRNFAFRWKVRDTGSNRDWSNDYLDEYVPLSGFAAGLRFKEAVGMVSGGASIIVRLIPLFANNVVPETGLSAIEQVRFRFSFIGVERKVS